MNVYLLWHMRPLEGQEDLDPAMEYIQTDDKLCGVFSTEERALGARKELLTHPGFSEFPDNFSVACYELDKVEWAEGFD